MPDDLLPPIWVFAIAEKNVSVKRFDKIIRYGHLKDRYLWCFVGYM